MLAGDKAFAAVGSRLGTLDNPAAYLRVCVVNGARALIRRRATVRRLSRVTVTERQLPNELADFADVLGRLTHRRRTVVVLRYVSGLADAQIAEILGCTPATVRSLAHRAIEQLRKELQ